MNQLKVFENPAFGQVRTVIIDDEPWFVGKDVADILGYQNGSRDTNRHVEEEDRQKVMVFDGNQNKETINEKTRWSGTQTVVTPKGRETFRLLCQGLI